MEPYKHSKFHVSLEKVGNVVDIQFSRVFNPSSTLEVGDFLAQTYFVAITSDRSWKNQSVYVNNLDLSLGWKEVISCKDENKMKDYGLDPVKIFMVARENTLFVKTT